MTTDELIRELNTIADVGIVHHSQREILIEAAERLFELDERIAIMSEGDILRDEKFD